MRRRIRRPAHQSPEGDRARKPAAGTFQADRALSPTESHSIPSKSRAQTVSTTCGAEAAAIAAASRAVELRGCDLGGQQGRDPEPRILTIEMQRRGEALSMPRLPSWSPRKRQEGEMADGGAAGEATLRKAKAGISYRPRDGGTALAPQEQRQTPTPWETRDVTEADACTYK